MCLSICLLTAKVSTEQIAQTHVPHPGVSESFHRSALLIGSRGVGKTFLLRHRKQGTHQGAVYINLVDTLHSVARDAGVGGRSLVFPPKQASQISSKTAALIAVKALKLCNKEVDGDLPLRLTLMDALLPRQLRDSRPFSTVAIRELRHAINTCSLSRWTPVDSTGVLTDVLGDLAAAYPHRLALFFDRAEDISVPSIRVLMKLLDQSVEALTVIAARPGVAQLMPRERDLTLVPGDHHDLIHVGVRPYDADWEAFVRMATRNYLAANDIGGAEQPDLSWAIRLARDSVRQAVDFAQLALATRSPADLDQRLAQMRLARDKQLAVVRVQLAPDHVDFRRVIEHLHRHVRERLAKEPQFSLTLRLVDANMQMKLYEESNRLADFLLRSIRGGAFFLPAGNYWHPYELPTDLELAPLLTWNGENTRWITS